jgi:hypothetical protein
MKKGLGPAEVEKACLQQIEGPVDVALYGATFREDG